MADLIAGGAPTESRTLRPRDFILLALIALALLLPGLANLPPVDRDESRYAVASTQMLESGDLIDIRYQELPRHLQPVGIYWLQSAAVAALSSPEAKQIWAFRLPSLASAIAAALLTGWLCASVLGRRAGLLAGVLLAASASLAFEARIAKIDATLLLAITGAQALMMLAYLDRLSRPRLMAGLFWIALGAGLLLKGPIILLVVGSTAAALVLWDRKARWLLRLQPLWGVPLMLAVALPWYVAVGFATDGEFYARAIGKSMMGKVANSQQGHSGPAGYHTALFSFMFWPGSLFALLAIPFAWRERSDPTIRFLIAWILPTFLIFELVATKLPHYVLPTYPALAMLAAAAITAPAVAVAPGARALGYLYAGVWLLCSALMAALGSIALHQFGAGPDWVSITLAVGGFGAACAALWRLSRREAPKAVAMAAAAAVTAYLGFYGYAAPRLDRLWISPRIVTAAAGLHPCPGGTLITAPYHEPSLVFLHGWNRTKLAPSPELAAQYLSEDRACGLALIGADRREAFLAEARRLGLTPKPVGELPELQNYSDGEVYRLTFYRANGG